MKEFYDTVRPLFGRMSQKQVDGLTRLLAITEGLPISERAYILATAHHETAKTMQPVRETRADTDAEAVSILEKAYAEGRLGQVSIPYWRFDIEGKTWLGRGYVQLTHKSNYAKAALDLGVDLLSDPNAALNPEVAGLILRRGMLEGWFTGKKLSDYLPGDYVNARRVVNGTDRAQEIARIARVYEDALRTITPDTNRNWQPFAIAAVALLAGVTMKNLSKPKKAFIGLCAVLFAAGVLYQFLG